MQIDKLAKLDKALGLITNHTSNMLKSKNAKKILRNLHRIAEHLDDDCELLIGLHFGVISHDREAVLPLVGLHYIPDAGKGKLCIEHPEYLCFEVNDEIVSVPRGICPNCWHKIDDALFTDGDCPNCNYGLGPDIALVMQSEDCPACGEGHISVDNPICPKCYFEAKIEFTVWPEE